jgi:sodium/proline symporter
VIKRDAGQREIVHVGRLCVIVVSVVALILALRPNDTILGIVAYSWGGFGAAFGPLVLFALYSRRTSWQAALAGMVTGTVVLVVWKQVGLGDHLYELVPGFVSNCLVILGVGCFVRQGSQTVLEQYDNVIADVHGRMS